MAENEFAARVTARHVGKEQVEITARGHSLTCDHPPELGGDDLGPTPSEFLLAGLVSSIAQHIGRHAQRLRIPVQSVEAKANFEVGQEKGDVALDPLSFLSSITAQVEIKGDLTSEQFATLKYIGENCVVAHSLRRGTAPDVRVRLVGPG
jgi:putative redox protein